MGERTAIARVDVSAPGQLILRPHWPFHGWLSAGAGMGNPAVKMSDSERDSAQGHGQRHPGAGHGCRREGQIRTSGHADGHGRRCNGPVHPVPEVRCRCARLAGSRPLRAVRRTRLDAALRLAASHRLSGRVDGGVEQLPPARLQDCRPPRVRPCAGHRDHDGPAGAGPRQCRRHGVGRAAHQCPARRCRRRSLHVCDCRRRLPDGRHQP